MVDEYHNRNVFVEWASSKDQRQEGPGSARLGMELNESKEILH